MGRPRMQQTMPADRTGWHIGAHYHIRPGLAPQIPLPLADGRSPLDATMAFFEKPLRFRGLPALAEEDAAAARLGDNELKRAAAQIRALSAAHPCR